jgi:hypothetical protein
MARRKTPSPTNVPPAGATRRAAEDSRLASGGSDGVTAAAALDALRADPPAHDEAGLLAQSPRVLFFFWSFAREPGETLRRALGEASGGLRLAVRLVDLERHEVVTYAAAPAGQSIWFEARPGRAYRAEVGYFAPGAPFVRVLASNVVETAREAPSRVSDQAADFRVSAPDFARILAASGFVESAAEFLRDPDARGSDEDGPPDSSSLAPVAHGAPSSIVHHSSLSFAPGEVIEGATQNTLRREAFESF